MKTEVKKLEKNKTVITVEVPPKDVNAAIDKATESLAKKVRIPGFRHGKTPLQILKAKVGMDAITHHAVESELEQMYQKAVEQVELEPITKPEIKIIETMQEGKKFVFEATVETKPDVTMKGYKGIKVKRPSASVAAKDVDVEIGKLQDRFADLQPSKAKTIHTGHFVVLDFEGSIDGTPFEGGSSSDHLVEIGSGTFWKGFEEQLIGMKKNEENVIKVKAPSDYYVPSLAGKEVDFKVKIKEIKDKKLPDLDDAFAKKMGFDEIKKLKADIKKNIKERKNLQADTSIQMQVIQHVINTSNLEVPKLMVDDYKEKMFQDFVQTLTQRGVDVNDYLKMTNQTMDSLRDSLTEEATRTVKQDIVLDALAKKEKITVKDDDLDGELRALLERMGEASKQIISGEDAAWKLAYFRKTLRTEMLKKKAVDFLIEHADVEETSERRSKKK